MQLIIVGAALALLIYGALGGWVYLSQDRLLYRPRRELVATPAEVGFEFEEVWLTTRLGTRIHAWWLPHESSRFTLLFCHGNGGNISHRLESFRIFHRLGLSVLIFDYSGYGLSDGAPSELATQADSRAAWDWLTEVRGVDPASILLFGRSLGGGVAASLARELNDEGVRSAGLILESTFSSIADMGSRAYPWLPVKWLVKYRYDSVEALTALDLPALFLHSREDDTVAYDSGYALYDGYGGPKWFEPLQGDHNSGYLLTGDAYIAGLDRYLTRLLNKAKGD